MKLILISIRWNKNTVSVAKKYKVQIALKKSLKNALREETFSLQHIFFSFFLIQKKCIIAFCSKLNVYTSHQNKIKFV